MVPVDREDRNTNVHVWILVVDMIEDPVPCISISLHMISGISSAEPLKDLAAITEHLQLARLVAQAVHPKRSHDIEHGFP